MCWFHNCVLFSTEWSQTVPPAHFCLFFTRDKFEVRQRCKICQIYWFLVPDTMPNSFCNNPALQCVLVHQWLCPKYPVERRLALMCGFHFVRTSHHNTSFPKLLEVTYYMEEWFAVEPRRVAKILVNWHLFFLLL